MRLTSKYRTTIGSFAAEALVIKDGNEDMHNLSISPRLRIKYRLCLKALIAPSTQVSHITLQLKFERILTTFAATFQ
jgi:hypothetical protein